jgi:CRISPR system Cascade subunit CasB
LVDELIRLAATSDELSDSRAALAELRRGFQNPIRAARHVARFVPEPKTRADEGREERYYWVATLFAWHKLHKPGISLGHAFRSIKDKSDSVERRFFMLLTLPSENLPERLGQAVRLLKSNEVPLDWHRLLDDVLRWDDIKKPRQFRLAKDFFSKSADTGSETETRDTHSEEGVETL